MRVCDDRPGGRSERTTDDYRKKLKLFQRWLAVRRRRGRGRRTLSCLPAWMVLSVAVVVIPGGRGLEAFLFGPWYTEESAYLTAAVNGFVVRAAIVGVGGLLRPGRYR